MIRIGRTTRTLRAKYLVIVLITVLLVQWWSSSSLGSYVSSSNSYHEDDSRKRVDPRVHNWRVIPEKRWSRPPPPLPARVTSRIYQFYFDPIHILLCRRELLKKFLLHADYPPQGMTLFDMYDPIARPFRNIFPLQDTHAIELSKNYEMLGDDYTTVMRYESMLMVTDKLRFSKFLISMGYGSYVPKIFYSREEIHTFPIVIKLTRSTASSGVFLAYNQSHFENVLQSIGQEDMFFQEFVVNQVERAVQVSAVHGRLIKLICHERDLDEPIYRLRIKWREAPPIIPDDRCHLPLYSSIVRDMNFTGIGNFDVRFKADPLNGEMIPQIMEFNPRISGTLARDANLLAEMICSIQWNGRGQATDNGCFLPKKLMTTAELAARGEVRS